MAANDKKKQADEGEKPSGDQVDVDEREGSEGEGAPEGSGGSGLKEGDSLLAAREAEEAEGDAEEEDAPVAGHLGAARYVMTGFFLTCIAAAYVLGRTLEAGWGKLAEAAWFQKSVSVLARVGEEERSELCTLIGAVVALGFGVYAYRRADVRQWTDEVASELAKVTWPDKTEVTNSTIIVVVTSAFATLYLALLDRFWGFVTNLVYGS